MANYSLKINYNSINKKIKNKTLSSSQFQNFVYSKISPIFNRKKTSLINRFWTSNITQEIQNGSKSANISDTLNGYGNLFSFIGFFDDDDPISPLMELLENIELSPTIRRGNYLYFRINIPSKGDIESLSDMPWESGNSWVYGIERGISGLSHYMYKTWENGRSKEAFQLPYENQDDLSFNPKPYLPEFLRDFRISLSKISKE